ncbi:MAG: proton-conducting transporter membrane subunit [Planctomycetaceae bacterium]
MNTLHFPWLEIAIVLPLAGALATRICQSTELAKRISVVVAALTLLATAAAWQDFYSLDTEIAHDSWDVIDRFTNLELFVIDELSAPLLPLTSLIYLLTILTTQRTKARRFSFSWTLVSLSISVATFSCRTPWGVIFLMAAATWVPYLELRRREKPTGVYVAHMVAFVLLMVVGQGMVDYEGDIKVHSMLAILPLIGAVFIRNGAVPTHCWMTDLIEHSTLGTWIVFVMPMTGAYAGLRLVVPIAPDWALRSIAVISLLTAIYAVGMALIQKDTRRFFCYLMLSQSSLVLVGLEMSTPLGLAGALCVWLSIGLAMTGFGLIIRSLEARTGRLNLTDYHGLFEHVPGMAGYFLLMGLASVGFPGTIGFVSLELLVEGASQRGALIGTVVVLASALCGIAIMHAYFRIFTGKHHRTSISLKYRPSERVAYFSLVVLIVVGGLVPQPGVSTRYHAAVELLNDRNRELIEPRD